MAKTIEIKHVNKGYMLGEEKVPVLRLSLIHILQEQQAIHFLSNR